VRAGTALNREAPIKSTRHTNASVLVSVLWVLAILALIVVGVLYTARLDLTLGKHYGDRIQARYLALAGVEKAKALLYQDLKTRRAGGLNHSADLYDNPTEFQDIAFARGRFRVFHGGENDDGHNRIYGILDEERFLNFNTASAEDLMKLNGMTPEVAASIVDYRDPDSNVSPGGAEYDDYAALRPPYVPRDGPFRTLGELQFVMGIPRQELLGEDANLNGLLDPDENDGELFKPPDNRDSRLDRGWIAQGTVFSGVRNVNAKGEARVNAQKAGEADLQSVTGITSELAKAIVEYRKENELKSVVDLLEVRQMSSNSGSGNSNGANKTPTGSPLIDRELFRDIADSFTVIDEESLPGRVNVNTAPMPVLLTLPGLDETLADAVVAHRSSTGFYQSIADLLEVPGMTESILKQLAPRVTTRSETYRITSEGRVTSTGARAMIQLTVRVGTDSIETLSYREDL
jgi:DNA uptake protein ComE-like DNA-binding protein